MKSSGHNKFTRKASPIKGAEIAAMPRTHAIPEAGEDTRKKNPQRMDLLKRIHLSARQEDN